MNTKLKIETLGAAPKPQTENLVERFDLIIDEFTNDEHMIKFEGEYFYIKKLKKKWAYKIEEAELECLCNECQAMLLDLDDDLVMERIEGRVLFTALTNSLIRIKELNTFVNEDVVDMWRDVEEYIEYILGTYVRRSEIFKQAS